jgi:hypothetical protein
MIVDSKSYYMDSKSEAEDFYLRLVFNLEPNLKAWPPQYVLTSPKNGVVEPKWLVLVTEFGSSGPDYYP